MNVLFVATTTSPLGALDEVAGQMATTHGATVRVATFAEPNFLAGAHHIDEVHFITSQMSLVGGRPVRRYSPEWFWVLLRNPVRRAKDRRADKILRPWLRGKVSPWLMKHAREADVLVALDSNAVYCVWELAQRNPTARAVSGLYNALDVVVELSGRAPEPRLAGGDQAVGDSQAVAQ